LQSDQANDVVMQIRIRPANTCAVLQTAPNLIPSIAPVKIRDVSKDAECNIILSTAKASAPLLRKFHIDKLLKDGFVVISDFVDEIFVQDLLVTKIDNVSVQTG
jgi:hypothetical protein